MHPGALLQSSTSQAVTVVLGVSPASYTAQAPGSLYLFAGTVSKIEHKRAGATLTLGLIAGAFHLRTGDTLTVTYAVVPTHATFIPD